MKEDTTWSLSEFRREYHFDIVGLAARSKVSEANIRLMLIGMPVTSDIVDKVMSRLEEDVKRVRIKEAPKVNGHPTVKQLFDMYSITPKNVAIVTSLSIETIILLYVYNEATPQVLEVVLHEFSKLIGCVWKKENVKGINFVLKPDLEKVREYVAQNSVQYALQR